ncbi:MAG: hypothetical protein ABI035_12080 [Gemmatimonadaceae bacterium]
MLTFRDAASTRVRIWLITIIAIAVGSIFLRTTKPSYGAEIGARCLTGGDEAPALHGYGEALATLTDSIYAVTRQRYHIPMTDSSNVELVTSDSVCALAGDAFNAHLTSAQQRVNRPVYVVRVGTVYIVSDPSLAAPLSGLTPNMVFDSDFALLAQFVA